MTLTEVDDLRTVVLPQTMLRDFSDSMVDFCYVYRLCNFCTWHSGLVGEIWYIGGRWVVGDHIICGWVRHGTGKKRKLSSIPCVR